MPPLSFARGSRARSGLCFLLLAVLPLLAVGAVQETVVFRSETEGYHTFRIPAIVRAANGDLLAFAEGRKHSRSDTGDIDLLLRRSSDGGKTWGPIQLLWDDGGNTCGNPCPVIDETTGRVFLLASHNFGHDKEDEISYGKSRAGRSVWVLSSTDHGATWSKPVEITASTKKPDWSWYATGPGIGIQIKRGPHAGRLEAGKSFRGAHAIFSDDHGATWQLGEAIKPHMNECQVVELFEPAGTLLMDMRSYRGKAQRAQSRSHDGGKTWTEAVDVPALVEPVCQASIVRWENAGTADAGWLLFSNPADPKRRRNLVVRASLDNGASWSHALTLQRGFAAYSCLVVLDANTAACLYEFADKRPSEQIIFARFDRADLVAR
jgi:sialidase-1